MQPVVKGFDEITAPVAAKILGMSLRCIQRMCAGGVFESAFKPGYGDKARWRLSRAEVSRRKQPKLTKKKD